MSLENILGDIRKKFFSRKPVDFPDLGLHFEIEPISSAQELDVANKCSKYEGADYMDALKRITLSYAIKKINETELTSPTLTLSDGTKVLTQDYLEKQIAEWHGSLRDILFVAYVDTYKNLEKKLNESAKFERFVKPVAEEKIEPSTNFKRMPEDDTSSPDLTDTDKMSKEVEKELEEAQKEIDNASTQNYDKK